MIAARASHAIAAGNPPEEDMLKGFRDFVLRGNVVDLAVAVILGAAFNNIVNSFVKDILGQLIAAVAGKPDFSSVVVSLHGTPIQIGSFLNAVISFLIVASVVYFGVVLPLNTLLAKLKKPAPEAPSSIKTCPECLSEIPLAARRCCHCAQPVA
ncbi:MAG: large conductance mechanosensitive channel protein MscL [Terracidiphilus sp.]